MAQIDSICLRWLISADGGGADRRTGEADGGGCVQWRACIVEVERAEGRQSDDRANVTN